MNGSPFHILLVEDDDIDREKFVRCLQSQRSVLRLTAVPDAVTALTILRSPSKQSAPDRPNVILLDLCLPGMSGFEFLQIVRQDPDLKGSTVFVLTGSSNPQDKITAYAYHVAGYVLKENLDTQCSQLVTMFEAYGRMHASMPRPNRQKRL